MTSAKHTVSQKSVENVDGLLFYRSSVPSTIFSKLPVLNQWMIVKSLSTRLDEIIPEIKPDILHAHSPALNGLAAIIASKKYKIPVVYECRAFWEDAAVDHGTTSEGSLRYRITQALETYVFKKADAVTTICEGLRNDIISRGLSADKVTVIPNAVDIEKFVCGVEPDRQLRQDLGLVDKVVLGFIGSFYAYEGIPLLLEALPRILIKVPNVRLLLVGGGPQESLIRQKTAQLGLEGQVIFTGRVPHDRVQEYYNQVDIFVYPRLSMRLTDLVTPLKPLEAMAQGRLVVASDVGGHKELIAHEQTGYLFKAGDVSDLVIKILDLIENRQHWVSLRNNGRRFVQNHRSWSVSVANYSNVYNTLSQAIL